MSIHQNGKRPTGLEIFYRITDRKMSLLYVKGDPALIERLRIRIEAPPFNLSIAEDNRAERGIIQLGSLSDRPLMDAAHIIMSEEFESLEISTDG